jgi:ATP-dependent Lon protease
MTGEISLNGKVLAIGGVKEKTMAATREGIRKLIFPKANEKDVDDLPDYIKEGIIFHFVEEYSDVFKILFPNTKIQ